MCCVQSVDKTELTCCSNEVVLFFFCMIIYSCRHMCVRWIWRSSVIFAQYICALSLVHFSICPSTCTPCHARVEAKLSELAAVVMCISRSICARHTNPISPSEIYLSWAPIVVRLTQLRSSPQLPKLNTLGFGWWMERQRGDLAFAMSSTSDYADQL